MNSLLKSWLLLGKSIHALAGAILLIMFLMTLADVTIRFVWKPIPGTYELISFMGGLIVGFSIPFTTQMKGHVNVDFAIDKMPKKCKMAVNFITRIMVMIFFFIIGWNLVSMGIDLHKTQEVSQTLHVPYYPVAFGMGIAFLVQAIQFCFDACQIYGGHYE